MITITPRVLKKITPVVIGYIALGMACGMLGEKAGLTSGIMFVMSVLVYGGSSQFIGIAMMMQGASFISIGLTVFVVGLRNALFTSSLAPYVRKCSDAFTTLFSYGLTDECFAVNLASYEDKIDWQPGEAMAVNLLCMFTWAISNALGCFLSSFIHLNLALVSYILTAMFLGIWSNYMGSRSLVVTGIGAGLLSVFLATIVPYKLHIVLASLLVSGLMTFLSLRGGRRHD
jgi:4-azaleucine resistance transporter AzlC